MSEIENGRLGLYGTKHSKCNHLMTLGFKGLTLPHSTLFRHMLFIDGKTEPRPIFGNIS